MGKYKSLDELELKPCQFLAASKNYLVFNEWEEADLYVKKEDKIVYGIGYFYGDPEGSVISKEEKFCVTFGEGFTVYRLEPPFEKFRSESRLLEYGQENVPDGEKWVEACSFIEEDVFEITLENGFVERIK